MVVVLSLLVSPLGAAVCEVVCGSPAHAGAHPAPPDASERSADAHHAHHGHVMPETPALVTADPAEQGGWRTAGPDCDPLSSTPARVRATFSDTPALVASMAASAPPVTTTPGLHAASTVSPPAPPHLAPVPLRI